MNEKVELILGLKEEVSRLVNDRDETKEKCNNIEIQLDETFDSIKDISCSIDDANDMLHLLVQSRVRVISILLAFAVGAIMFCFSKITGFPNVYWFTPYSVLFACVFIVAGVGAFLTTLFYNKIENYLVNKYPNIKKVYDKVNSLTNEKNFREQNIKKMRKKIDELKVILEGIEYKLERKMEELDSIEKVYFDSLVGKTFITEDENHHMVGIVGRGKTKVRTPDFKENLEN